ncbi:10330_t:CDS:2 [Diversispora eburnea]|uniref:10330_t:CDS:1 n=1 Tax=Diversispora eburnea TaxID=1213867 RepID=A0A9N8ZAQ9_9GLOM|nr:10330_t:CDS:2 [Diversispora eburnea]
MSPKSSSTKRFGFSDYMKLVNSSSTTSNSSYGSSSSSINNSLYYDHLVNGDANFDCPKKLNNDEKKHTLYSMAMAQPQPINIPQQCPSLEDLATPTSETSSSSAETSRCPTPTNTTWNLDSLPYIINKAVPTPFSSPNSVIVPSSCSNDFDPKLPQRDATSNNRSIPKPIQPPPKNRSEDDNIALSFSNPFTPLFTSNVSNVPNILQKNVNAKSVQPNELTQGTQVALTQSSSSSSSSSQNTRRDGNEVDNEKEQKKAALYKTEMCRNWEERGSCRYGSKCQYAHSPVELREVAHHPKYKTEICKTFWQNGTCPYGKRCCFIHNDTNGILLRKNTEASKVSNKSARLGSSELRAFTDAYFSRQQQQPLGKGKSSQNVPESAESKVVATVRSDKSAGTINTNTNGGLSSNTVAPLVAQARKRLACFRRLV